MTIAVEGADSGVERDWTAYVASHPDAHLAHCWAWKAIFSTVFGHDPHFLVARKTLDDGSRNLVGVLPLFHVKSLLFGSALIAVPYLNGGGVLADDGKTERRLAEAAIELGRELGVKYVELRERSPSLAGVKDLLERSHKAAMLLPLMDDPQEMLMSFPSKLRTKIRRPEKSGFHAEVFSGASEACPRIEAFYAVFSRHMRDLGTPVYPKDLFVSVARAFDERCRVILTWLDGTPTSCGMTIGHGNRVEIPWASSLMKYNQFRPNTLLFWHAIKAACEDGYATFDFGRSSYDSGTYRFKEQWGCEPVPLYWYYAGGKDNVPNVDPRNPKFSALVRCWKRLPVPLANAVGPWITRSLP